MSLTPKSLIESVQSVSPLRVTDPRSSRRISVKNNEANVFQKRFHFILYYKNASSIDTGSLVAGCARESLGEALDEQPILAGRLRREERGKGGEREGVETLEIVPNDSGVRFVEARSPIRLSEFLVLENKQDAEAELVFWKNFEETNYQYFPLFYIQVTNFQCGGYSIGISCSLLLADPLAITSFLINWAKIHSKLVSKSYLIKSPIFFLPNFTPKVPLTTSDQNSNQHKTAIFKTWKINQNHKNDDEFMSICIQEAERELGIKIPLKVCLFSETSDEDIKVENYSRDVSFKSPNEHTQVSWDDLGAWGVSFYKENTPICVSSWIYSAPKEGLAILIPSLNNSHMNVIVSLPN